MRLLTRLERLEGGLGQERAVGLVWTDQEQRLDLQELPAGTHLALDVYTLDPVDGVPRWRCTERLTSDPQDLGLLYGAGGAVLGRVTDIDGSLVTITDAAAGAAEA